MQAKLYVVATTEKAQFMNTAIAAYKKMMMMMRQQIYLIMICAVVRIGIVFFF